MNQGIISLSNTKFSELTSIIRAVWQTVRRITNEIVGVKGLILPKVLCLFDLEGRGTSKRNDGVFFNFETTESSNWNKIITSLVCLATVDSGKSVPFAVLSVIDPFSH